MVEVSNCKWCKNLFFDLLPVYRIYLKSKAALIEVENCAKIDPLGHNSKVGNQCLTKSANQFFSSLKVFFDLCIIFVMLSFL